MHNDYTEHFYEYRVKSPCCRVVSNPDPLTPARHRLQYARTANKHVIACSMHARRIIARTANNYSPCVHTASDDVLALGSRLVVVWA